MLSFEPATTGTHGPRSEQWSEPPARPLVNGTAKPSTPSSHKSPKPDRTNPPCPAAADHPVWPERYRAGSGAQQLPRRLDRNAGSRTGLGSRRVAANIEHCTGAAVWRVLVVLDRITERSLCVNRRRAFCRTWAMCRVEGCGHHACRLLVSEGVASRPDAGQGVGRPSRCVSVSWSVGHHYVRGG